MQENRIAGMGSSEPNPKVTARSGRMQERRGEFQTVNSNGERERRTRTVTSSGNFEAAGAL